MLNREKYAEEVLNIACSGNTIAKKKGKLYRCSEVFCTDCDFYEYGKDCNAKVLEWANSECTEPTIDWSKNLSRYTNSCV